MNQLLQFFGILLLLLGVVPGLVWLTVRLYNLTESSEGTFSLLLRLVTTATGLAAVALLGWLTTVILGRVFGSLGVGLGFATLSAGCVAVLCILWAPQIGAALARPLNLDVRRRWFRFKAATPLCHR